MLCSIFRITCEYQLVSLESTTRYCFSVNLQGNKIFDNSLSTSNMLKNADINWLMLAGSISYISWFLGDGLTAIRYLRIQLPLYLLITGLSGGICLWLIPIFGLKGAAFALLIAALVEVLLMAGIILHGIHRITEPAEA